MTDYENDPRVTLVNDDDYRIAVEGQEPWRVYREGDRWFSQAPPRPANSILPGSWRYEHPSKVEAFKSMLNPRGGQVVVPPARFEND